MKRIATEGHIRQIQAEIEIYGIIAAQTAKYDVSQFQNTQEALLLDHRFKIRLETERHPEIYEARGP